MLQRNFHLNEGSDPIDAGTQVSNFYDYNLGQRPFGTAMDIGAYEFGAIPTNVPYINTNEHAIIHKIYPNPSTGKFEIELSSSESDEVNIEIIGIDGKIIFKERYNNTNTIKVNATSLLPAGMYLLKVTTGSKTIVKQIIIN